MVYYILYMTSSFKAFWKVSEACGILLAQKLRAKSLRLMPRARTDFVLGIDWKWNLFDLGLARMPNSSQFFRYDIDMK